MAITAFGWTAFQTFMAVMAVAATAMTVYGVAQQNAAQNAAAEADALLMGQAANNAKEIARQNAEWLAYEGGVLREEEFQDDHVEMLIRLDMQEARDERILAEKIIAATTAKELKAAQDALATRRATAARNGVLPDDGSALQVQRKKLGDDTNAAVISAYVKTQESRSRERMKLGTGYRGLLGLGVSGRARDYGVGGKEVERSRLLSDADYAYRNQMLSRDLLLGSRTSATGPMAEAAFKGLFNATKALNNSGWKGPPASTPDFTPGGFGDVGDMYYVS